MSGITVRDARDEDAKAIREIYRATYGSDYAYPEFYDDRGVKRLIYADDTMMLVAEQDGGVVGTASVLLEIGAYSDLVGEFGRLAVHPSAQGRGVAGALMAARVERARSRLHVGLVEARTAHDYSQRVAEQHGFTPVGVLPSKLRFAVRETSTLHARWFGDALALRRNHPRVIPEAYGLATLALDGAGLVPDVIVDETAAPYPDVSDLTGDDLTTRGYAALLRLPRGRVAAREVFGPLRLDYGFFRLRARQSHYLLAREGDRIVGAVGAVIDEVERTVRVFEVIALDDRPIRFLLRQLEARCRDEWRAAYVEVDVSAHAPRMQRTLLELGFVPVAYVPALAFDQCERLDIVKMALVREEPEVAAAMTERCALVGAEVDRRRVRPTADPTVRDAVEGANLFAGLTDEQTAAVAACGRVCSFTPGATIFVEAAPADDLYLIVTGEVDVRRGDGPDAIGSVSAGEALGEMSLLTGGTHSASAVAATVVDAVAFRHADLHDLIRRRPDVGVVMYRNLGVGVSRKLSRADLALTRPAAPTSRP